MTITTAIIPAGTELHLPIANPFTRASLLFRVAPFWHPPVSRSCHRSPGSHLMQQNDLFGAEAAAWQSLASGVTGCREAQSRDSQHLLIIPAPPSLKKEKR